jgi:undecaprenyl-diphosphatase
MMPIVLGPILETLKHWDVTLFYFINNGTHNRFFDVVMPFLTNLDKWRIPIAIMWMGLLIFGGKKGRIVAVLAVVCLALSDQLSSNILKGCFARVRPCTALEKGSFHSLVSCTGAYSFPSSHATNIFAQATLFSYTYRKLTPALIIFALIVGYSRVYVGVHYPADVLFGAVLGIICAGFVMLAKSLVASASRRGKENNVHRVKENE